MLCFNIPVFSSPRASVMSIIVKGLAGYCLTIACLYILLIVLSLPQHLKSQYLFLHISSKPLCGTGQYYDSTWNSCLTVGRCLSLARSLILYKYFLNATFYYPAWRRQLKPRPYCTRLSSRYIFNEEFSALDLFLHKFQCWSCKPYRCKTQNGVKS